MRHLVDRRKLGLPSDQRKHLLTNMARQFIRHGYVHTTFGRAKEVQRIVEKLITVGKEDSLAARRKARQVLVGHSKSTPATKATLGKTDLEKTMIRQRASQINGEDLVTHLFNEVAPRYKDRKGGYTRLVKTGTRRGDGAQAAVLMLVE
ncbi:MAG: 50S ribosomal protein L17 [Fimbriimonadales bacterium]